MSGVGRCESLRVSRQEKLKEFLIKITDGVIMKILKSRYTHHGVLLSEGLFIPVAFCNGGRIVIPLNLELWAVWTGI